MYITIIEGRVNQGRWTALEQAYRDAIRHVPLQLRETYLIQDEDSPRIWRLISIWRSREAYEEVEKLGHIETSLQVFRSVDVEPTHRQFEVRAHHLQV
jgi:quinol monooxygenase YgiN